MRINADTTAVENLKVGHLNRVSSYKLQKIMALFKEKNPNQNPSHMVNVLIDSLFTSLVQAGKIEE